MEGETKTTEEVDETTEATPEEDVDTDEVEAEKAEPAGEDDSE